MSQDSLMLQEIRQQPAVLERIASQPAAAIGRLRRRFAKRRPAMAIVVARGTSDNAAIFGRYLFAITLGMPTVLAAPSVATQYRRNEVPSDALLIAISQSGESTDINGYVEAAKQSGAFCIGITNAADSTLAGLADEALLTQAGDERSVAATKTYTAQLMMLYFVAEALGAPIVRNDLMRIPAAVESLLGDDSTVRMLAERFRTMSRAIVIGRGFNFGNSLELALKLMETSYVVATGFSGADFAHGPIAIVDKKFPVLAFCPGGSTAEQTAALVDRLNDSGAEVICLSPHEMPCSHRINIPRLRPSGSELPEDVLSPIPMIVPGQVFAARLAASKGLNPDEPRMLSKVTQTM